MNIADYVPSDVVSKVLAIAGECFEPDESLLFVGLLVQLIARDLASAVFGPDVATDGALNYRGIVRHFERAPETETLVMRLLQAARSEWMRDPS